jgi:hypothetical protein
MVFGKSNCSIKFAHFCVAFLRLSFKNFFVGCECGWYNGAPPPPIFVSDFSFLFFGDLVWFD